MLHELLLALSGHPSPLLADDLQSGPFRDRLAPAEAALLHSLAHDLGNRHRSIRETASKIKSSHPSIVCRAVAFSVTSTQLGAFQKVILQVERDILEESPKLVGAYKIVPLSGVVGAFDGWSRKLEWLLSLVNFIDSPARSTADTEKNPQCTASQAMTWLRKSTHTGYPDIERLSYDLVDVAETAWLRQVSAWVLYGRLPAFGAADFFIFKNDGHGEDSTDSEYSVAEDLVPDFVTPATAHSILFIGTSLNHINDRVASMRESPSHIRSPGLALLPSHLAYLTALEKPISISNFTGAISAIRLSLSRHALQKLLPISKVLEILRLLRGFFLLERGEFAITLINAADQRLQNRFASGLLPRATDGLKNAIIKEGEVSAVLARTWTTLASLQSLHDDDDDEDLEFARDHVNLSIRSLDLGSPTKRGSIGASFDDLLFPTSTLLGLKIPSPLDLFLTPSDVDIYSRVHSYLLAIRRGHLRLTNLFLLSVLRRDHPSPKGSLQKGDHERQATQGRNRQRAARRAKILRPAWATIRSASFLLTELNEYFQGQVVQSSWDNFQLWLDPTREHAGSRPGTASSAESGSLAFGASASSQRSIRPQESTLHDPESLTVAHRTYISSLTHALLLEDARFTKELRKFMSSIDYLSALMTRLNIIYQHLNLESDSGVADTFTNYSLEEREVMRELEPAKQKVDGGVAALVEALRVIDAARIAEDRYGGGLPVEGEDVFVPQMSAGVDRLLLKLDSADLQKGEMIGYSLVDEKP